jgi:hypothetical protein
MRDLRAHLADLTAGLPEQQSGNGILSGLSATEWSGRGVGAYRNGEDRAGRTR